MKESVIRVFIGSPLDKSLGGQIDPLYSRRTEIMENWETKLSWVSPENWHLTWAFLGNVMLENVPVVQNDLRLMLQNQGSVTLDLEKLAIWPNARSPKVMVWQGNVDSPEIQHLAKAIRKNVLTDSTQETFKPHITLARFKKTKVKPNLDLIPQELAPIPRTWEIKDIHLYKSTLTPNGAIYESIEHFKLNL